MRISQADTKLPDNLPSVSAIICTLNEEGSLPATLTRILPFVSEVILIDGNSSDRTVEVARELRPDLRVYLQRGRGKGDALRLGFAQAKGEFIVTLDADGATDPAEMWRFVSPLLAGWDLVKGSRFHDGDPHGMAKHRIFGNWLLATIGNVLYSVSFSDMCSGYLGVTRSALDQLNWESLGPYDYEVVLICRAIRRGLRVKEVGHVDSGRDAGQSKMASWHTGWNQMKTILRERFRRR